MIRNKLRYLFILIIVPVLFLVSGCDIKQHFMGGNSDEELLGLQTVDSNSEKNTSAKQPNSLQDNSLKAAKGDELSLSDKYAVLDIDSGGRTTLFVPYREKNLSYNSVDFGNLPLPPVSGLEDEDLNTLVSAKVTGILYDPKSPSAIVNVMDEDYLVRPGDIVESFKIAGISKDYVAIKTGSNIYRAKVGDIVDGELYGTGIYNLGHKFAGHRKPARKEDIIVVSSKKKEAEQKVDLNVGFNELTLPPIPEINLKKNKTTQSNLPIPVGEVPKIDTN